MPRKRDDTGTQNSNHAKFVRGATLQHVLVMTSAGATGLMAIFVVDLADMYFLSLLGEVEVAAAIGYAGSILFFTTSVGIGLAIAATALVSRVIGAGEPADARRFATSSLIYSVALASALGMAIWALIPSLLDLLGATGRAHQLATSYLRIVVPTMPMLAFGICSSGILRAVGDGKRAMYVTLSGAIVNGILDPIFIFGIGLGIDGAALASVASRFAAVTLGAYGVWHVHSLVTKPQWAGFCADITPISRIAMLAILTNIATPIGNAYVTAMLAEFGDSAVAGWAVIGRIIPVAFGAIFALSGAVGPILGQNLGAKRYDRVKQALSDALLSMTVYVALVWGALALLHPSISAAFNASSQAAELIRVFCLWLAPLFGFFGALYVANAAFNNLGHPHYSTLFNWGRATLGNIPLVYMGSKLFGPIGVITANMISAVIFGTLAAIICYRLIVRMAKDTEPPVHGRALWRQPWPWPFARWRSR